MGSGLGVVGIAVVGFFLRFGLFGLGRRPGLDLDRTGFRNFDFGVVDIGLGACLRRVGGAV